MSVREELTEEEYADVLPPRKDLEGGLTIFIKPRKLISVLPYNQRSPWWMDIKIAVDVDDLMKTGKLQLV